MRDLDEFQRRALFEQFLQCLDREENLIHYRMSWGLQWNAGLFAASFAVMKIELPDPVFNDAAVAVLLVSGVVASFLSFIGIKAAHRQAAYLIDELETRLDIRRTSWTGSEFIRPIGDFKLAHRPARFVSAFFPLIFLVLWTVVLLYLLQGHVDLSFTRNPVFGRQ